MGGVSISTDLRGFFDNKTQEMEGLPRMRTGFAVNYGFMEIMEGGITVYSGDPGFKLASGQVRVQLVEESNSLPAMALGFMDITGARHPVEYSGYPITLSAYSSYAENKSIYFVARKGVANFGKVYLGIGGGRFKGHGPENSKLHGAFGGGELRLLGPVALMGEVDGRNVNAGGGMALGSLRPGHGLDISVNASVWVLYLQNIRKASQDIGLRPAVSGKLDFGMVLPAIRWGDKAKLADGSGGKEAPKVQPIILRPRSIEFANPVSDWKISLINPRGEVIRTFSGVGLPPKVFEWDGVTDRGDIVGPKANIRMEMTVKDIKGVEKMDVVPVKMEKAVASAKAKPVQTEYGKVVSGIIDWKLEQVLVLKALAGKTGPDGNPTMYQVRANELLAYQARKAGKPAEVRQYALRAAELARRGGLATWYKNPEANNLWNLAGSLMGDYRLWPMLYEANMESMGNPREMVPAGRVIRVPKEVLEEDYARSIHIFLETKPPESFTPSPQNVPELEGGSDTETEIDLEPEK